ncbi:hypothetical protein KUH03_09060 [Sphingobacterium sp. E70]|nr:hypothetical protein KUH03_09060 [Sphingobacterium sp. E70]
MYRTIAGINSVADNPGYKAVVIAPKPNGKITSASAEVETVYGTVKSAWKLENGLLKLEVSIPANSKAKVILPDLTKEIGSGTYYFESKI